MADTKGVLTWDEMVEQLNLNSGFFETSQYTFTEQMKKVVGNFDTAGMSHGNMQYNYAYANTLNRLYKYMFENHRQVIVDAFGIDTDKFDEFETATMTYTQDQLLNWGDSLTDWVNDPDGRDLKENWADLFANVLVTPECIDKYLEIMETDYVPDSIFLFDQMPCKSRFSLASFFDIRLNRGRYYPINTLLGDWDGIDADDTLTEEEKEIKKVETLNLRGNDNTNAIDSDTWKVRRECMAYLGGDYYGSPYDPENDFNINLEPATAGKLDQMYINLGSLQISNVHSGANPIKSVYLGSKIIGNNAEPYTTTKAPVTQFRTAAGSYQGLDKSLTSITLEANQPLWVDVQNFVAARTYYTTDGTTPTTNSPLYHENLSFTEPCTLKTLTVSLSGVEEAIKTLEIDIDAATYRYVRFIGHGDENDETTRLVELKALEGATNRLLNLTPISGEAPHGGATIETSTDGTIDHSTYPYWWGEGVPTLIYDLGALYPIDTIQVVMYSPDADPRQTQFKIAVSEDNSTWTQIADYSTNTTVQPLDGFSFTI